MSGSPVQNETVDPESFRRALSRFATGVVVVTTEQSNGDGCGITVNAFTSVSLDPPLILFCLDRAAYHVAAFAEAERFAINILGAGQEALSNRFAAERDDGLTGLEIVAAATGSPILAACSTALDCVRHATHEAGDHLIVVGRVAAIYAREGEEEGGDPLIYYGSAYRRLRT